MDIIEVRKLKKEAESEIEDVLFKFQNSTGVEITDLSLETLRYQMASSTFNVTTHLAVDIEVKL